MEKNLSMLSFCSWRMIKNIYLSCNSDDEYTIQKLADIANISRYNQIFNTTIKFLMDNNLIIITKTDGRKKIFKISTEKMVDLIESSEFYEEVSEYIRKTRLIYANI